MEEVGSKRKLPAEVDPSVGMKVKASGDAEKIEDGGDSVKVELRFFTPVTDDSEFDENSGLYIDSVDEEECGKFEFENLGWQGEFRCTRHGYARVLLGDRKIGTISYALINRDTFSIPGNISFWYACDVESGDLAQIASKFFDHQTGTLKKTLSNHLKCKDSWAMAHGGVFMYIKEMKLEAPYDRAASDENVHVGAQAISKLVNSYAICNENVTTTLVMYIPDGQDPSRMHYSQALHDLDLRQFQMAGFTPVHTNKPRCTYMVYELHEF